MAGGDSVGGSEDLEIGKDVVAGDCRGIGIDDQGRPVVGEGVGGNRQPAAGQVRAVAVLIGFAGVGIVVLIHEGSVGGFNRGADDQAIGRQGGEAREVHFIELGCDLNDFGHRNGTGGADHLDIVGGKGGVFDGLAEEELELVKRPVRGTRWGNPDDVESGGQVPVDVELVLGQIGGRLAVDAVAVLVHGVTGEIGSARAKGEGVLTLG